MNKMNLVLIILLFGFSFCSEKHKENILPSFNLLLIDSTTILNTSQIPEGEPIVVMYFSPDCEECQVETKNLLDNINSFKDTRFYFVTADPFSRLKVYQYYYKINKYPNIVLGRDIEYYFQKKLNVVSTPYLAVYNRNKELTTVFTGVAKLEDLIQSVKKL